MKTFFFTLMTAVAVCMTPVTFAETNRGPYAGAGVGLAEIDNVCPNAGDTVSGITITTVHDCDDRAVAFRGFWGYQLSSHFAAEVGFAYSGDYKLDAEVSGIDVNAESDYYTFEISGIARYPFRDSFSGFLRCGLHHWKAEIEANAGSVTISDSDNGINPLLGVGIEFRPHEKFGVRLEHARYFGDDDLDGALLQMVYYP